MYVKKGGRKGKDLSGQRYGKLVAVSPHNGYIYWKYLCDCGNVVVLRRQFVEKSPSASCGCVNNRLYGKLHKLLDGSPESFYWHGFLIGDGYFGNKNRRLSLSLAIKDAEHLKRFRDFIGNGTISYGISSGFSSQSPYSNISIMDSENLPKLAEMYGIDGAKTKNPPNIHSISEERLNYFIIGFIDADGSIRHQTGRTDCSMSIKKHHTWKNVLSEMFNKPSSINKEGYAFISITDNEILRKYKRIAISSNLPVLSRKWDLVDENAVSKYIIAQNRRDKTKEMILAGYTYKDISKSIGVSVGRVSVIVKEIGLR